MNCDNRIVASAFRYRWEHHLSGFILDRQQGSLRGRSIIQNLLEVDNTMFVRSLLDTDSAAMSLDFAAAFPSVSQEYCHRLLQEYGIPTRELNAARALYHQSRCKTSLKGDLYAGFDLASGVRQGCPLSPLLYAMIAELLMDKLESEIHVFLSELTPMTPVLWWNFSGGTVRS